MIGRFLFLLVFALALNANADDANFTLKDRIKELVLLRQQVLEAEADADRVKANERFLQFMREALNHPKSFETAFDTIPMLADLRSGDNYFRMLNWNLPYNNSTNRYFCFIQYYDNKDKEHKVIELKKGYRDLEGEDRKVFTERDWYGALYYQIIPSKTGGRNRKRAYMLLGWDGKDQYSHLKVMDVLSFTKRGGVKFGSDIFDYPDKRNIRRFIIQYKADASVSMRFDEKKKRVVFNALEPMQPDLEGMYEFYIPLLQFNAFEWKRRKWVYLEDVDVRIDDRKRFYNDPPEEQNLR